jgi:hypothetical protein
LKWRAKRNAVSVVMPRFSLTTSLILGEGTRKCIDYNFLELSEKEQQKVLTLMAETYKNTHPDVSTKEAKAVI